MTLQSSNAAVSSLRKYSILAIFGKEMGKNRTERIRNVLFNGLRYCGDYVLALGKSSSPICQSHGAPEGVVPHLVIDMYPAHGVLRL